VRGAKPFRKARWSQELTVVLERRTIHVHEMSDTEVLVLNGSPGSGKSTLANAIAEQLRQMDMAHAVVDVDELGRIYPELGNSLGWDNLRAIWPNYAAIPNLKVIVPVCIDNAQDLKALRNATPCKDLTICELVADPVTLRDRVTSREPNEYWRSKLRSLVDKHISKIPAEQFGDFRVRTDDKSINDAVQNILERLGWKAARSKPLISETF
jgi:energy-coupling factor transporter ATP-binding protein EcfA2